MVADVLIAGNRLHDHARQRVFRAGTCPRFLAQGQAATTVLDGDVRLGLSGAIDARKRILARTKLPMANCCLLQRGGRPEDVRARACVRYDGARGARGGARRGRDRAPDHSAAGSRRQTSAEQRAIRPNLILLAGGTDGGERETALYNAETAGKRRNRRAGALRGQRAKSKRDSKPFSTGGRPRVPRRKRLSAAGRAER